MERKPLHLLIAVTDMDINYGSMSNSVLQLIRVATNITIINFHIRTFEGLIYFKVHIDLVETKVAGYIQCRFS